MLCISHKQHARYLRLLAINAPRVELSPEEFMAQVLTKIRFQMGHGLVRYGSDLRSNRRERHCIDSRVFA